jgi:hypothetical protein
MLALCADQEGPTIWRRPARTEITRGRPLRAGCGPVKSSMLLGRPLIIRSLLWAVYFTQLPLLINRSGVERGFQNARFRFEGIASRHLPARRRCRHPLTR